MPLPSGTRRGPYEILAPLGAGGMGEVYRARDTRLQRDVAIKALPAEFASDAERLARFQREARLLASLNHPNIAAIYGLEEADGARYLVLEIVEGESLAQRLAAGPLPVEEALAVCAQIAAGVSAAHDAGVIHRDLKPGNVMVRHDGSVKVLDFGLAKGAEAPAAASDLSASPTISAGTQTGVILGTAAYMSPEQARGRPLDKRTDIWSFGCVLYECLTGRQVFRDETVSDTLASIIRSEPDWSLLPAGTPAKVSDLLRRCLQKDPRRRLRDIADAQLEIEEALAHPKDALPGSAVKPASRRGAGRPALWAVAGVVLGALAVLLLPRRNAQPLSPAERSSPIRAAVSLPPEIRLRVGPWRPSLAFSPDGRKFVFRAARSGVEQLFLRELDRPDPMPIAGTERGAFNPFFSPDGEWLAFFTPTELKKVSLSGGSPIKIAAVPPVTQGGAWSPDGTIVFAQINGGLSRVSASGGAPAALTTPDASAGERAHSWPQILPGGKELLLVVRAGTDFQDVAHSNIAVHSLETGKRRVLVQGATFGQWVSPGYLLFLRGTTLLAAPCAPGSWELTGPPVPVMENVLVGSSDGFPYLAASGSGLLVFATGGFVERDQDTVLWIDRAGHEEALPLPPGAYHTPRLSPDGRHLAVVFIPPGLGARVAIWIYDLDRKALSPLTPEPGRYFCPVWSPDGKRVVFARFETGEPTMAWKSADGSGTIERLSPSATPEFPTSWSPDGRAIAYTAATSGKENMDVWLLSLGPKRERRPWLATPFREFAPFLSPDGRFLAYVSNESGRHEVYVRPVAGEGKTRISIDGGAEPAWSPDGRELFYRSGEKLFSVPVQTSPEVSAGQARLVLTGSLSSGAREDYPRNWEISPDGKRFLFVREQGSNPPRIGELQLFANWRSAVERASSR